jgi:Protein of unknown function (DUF3617)
MLQACRPDPDGEIIMGLWERTVRIVSYEAKSVTPGEQLKAEAFVGQTITRRFCVSSPDQYVGIRAFDRLMVDGDCSHKQIEFKSGQMKGQATCILDYSRQRVSNLKFSGHYRNGNRIDADVHLDWPHDGSDNGRHLIRMKVDLRLLGDCKALFPNQER